MTFCFLTNTKINFIYGIEIAPLSEKGLIAAREKKFWRRYYGLMGIVIMLVSMVVVAV